MQTGGFWIGGPRNLIRRRSLLKAGFALAFWSVGGSLTNRESDRSITNSSREVAAQTDVIIIMVPDSPEVESAGKKPAP